MKLRGVSKDHYDTVLQYGNKLNDVIDYTRDFDLKTILDSRLQRNHI